MKRENHSGMENQRRMGKTKPENRVAQAIEARLITLIFKNKNLAAT